MERYRPREYETEDGPWDPISGGASALLGTIASLSMGVADFPIEIFRAVKKQKEASTKPKEEPQNQSSSGSNFNSVTPASASRSQSQLDLADEANSEYFPETSSSQTSFKVSYENSERPSSDSIETPLTSIASPTSSHGASLGHESSLKQALRGTLSRSGSRSNSRERRPGSRDDSPSRSKREFDPSKLTLDHAIGASKGVSRIVGAGLKSPMDFTLGLARGFHNAPKLYGDDTVRPQEKVTDFQSGLKAAGKVCRFFRLGYRVLKLYRNSVMASMMESRASLRSLFVVLRKKAQQVFLKA